eukprot:12147898-Alexandrium_andersonii.AAC.1
MSMRTCADSLLVQPHPQQRSCVSNKDSEVGHCSGALIMITGASVKGTWTSCTGNMGAQDKQRAPCTCRARGQDKG